VRRRTRRGSKLEKRDALKTPEPEMAAPPAGSRERGNRVVVTKMTCGICFAADRLLDETAGYDRERAPWPAQTLMERPSAADLIEKN